MNRIAGRAWITILFVLILLGGFIFFLFEYATSAGEWVVFSGSPHVYNAGNINCGTVIDSEGYVLLDMEGERDYSSDKFLRMSTVHWLGDRYGYVDAPALSSYAEQIAGFDMLNGVYNYGDQAGVVKLTLRASVQKAALTALGGRKGTVAVYNYKTGELLCSVSTPAFDPDNPPDITNDPDGIYEGMYLNRFTQSVYTPGSIFKIVTLAAALESVPDIETQKFTCSGSYQFGVDRITCEAVHGEQDIKTAFSNSCNCAFAQIALQLGKETLQKYVAQFGITQPVVFDGITTAGGSYDINDAHDVNVAWSAIGQYNDQVNPAAFLSFVGAIANGGEGNAMYFVDEISVGGSLTYEAQTKGNTRIMSSATAEKVAEYMSHNVSVRYGAENFPGLTVCAKTGTAEVGGEKKSNAMFAGFVQDDAYPYAFIVCMEDTGYGKNCIPVISAVLEACKKGVNGALN
ncbi:MAG: penicillin-binding protein [Oscillospiraceae bacterium]|nr:penicillin-binding protein [Oscillospiraceae bacterium]